MILRLDDWCGVVSSDTVVEQPTWEQVESAIRRLDQKRHTQAVLAFSQDAHMLIGGGLGKYNVCVTVVAGDDDVYYTLLEEDQPANVTASIVTGGQLGHFPANTLVSLEKTLDAAAVFFNRGVIASHLPWVRE